MLGRRDSHYTTLPEHSYSFFFLFCIPGIFVISAFVESYGKFSHVLLYLNHVSGNFSGVSLNVISNEQNRCAIHLYQFYETGLSDAVQDRTEGILRVRQT